MSFFLAAAGPRKTHHENGSHSVDQLILGISPMCVVNSKHEDGRQVCLPSRDGRNSVHGCTESWSMRRCDWSKGQEDGKRPPDTLSFAGRASCRDTVIAQSWHRDCTQYPPCLTVVVPTRISYPP
jgi:hypothetical protein